MYILDEPETCELCGKLIEDRITITAEINKVDCFYHRRCANMKIAQGQRKLKSTWNKHLEMLKN